MKITSFIKHPGFKITAQISNDDIQRHFIDIHSEEIKILSASDVRVGVRGFILIRDNEKSIIDSSLYGFIDSLWIDLLHIVDRFIHYGYGSAFLGAHNVRLTLDNCAFNKGKFYITSNDGEIISEVEIANISEFIQSLMQEAHHFFTIIKNQTHTLNYDDELAWISQLRSTEKLILPIPFYRTMEVTTQSSIANHYDIDWNLEFEKESSLLRELITEEKVLIKHIGSTSVKALAARPIIDIVIGTESSFSSEMVLNDLLNDYFIAHQDSLIGIKPTAFVMKGNLPTCNFHIYITERTSECWKKLTTFRELLNSSKDVAQKYENLRTGVTNEEEYRERKYNFFCSLYAD